MKTKIIATLGPASANKDIMRAMVENGVRIFRLNFSHSNADGFVQALGLIRDLEQELDMPLTAMGDLCGPKTRIGAIAESPKRITKGEPVLLGLPAEEASANGKVFLPLDFPELLIGLEEGMRVVLADGLLQFKVAKVLVKDRLFELEAGNEGTLTSNKGITFPGKFHPVAALTEKDRKDVREGLALGLDAFAMSFVQTAQDIRDLIDEMEHCGKRVPIIAKIERQNAVDNLESLLELADGLMVARGDLALECPLAEVPTIQKRIIRACRHAQKPVIVATQMMLSMVNNVVPTRAEASDVTNAMVDGADCVMLSEETAIGANPLEVVKTIREISVSAEGYFHERAQTPWMPREGSNNGKHMAYASCLLAQNFNSRALVCHTESGLTARNISSRRPLHDVFALSPNISTVKALNFAWGITPVLCTEEEARHTTRLKNFVLGSPKFDNGDVVVLSTHSADLRLPEPRTNKIEVFQK
ncbi:pyruvate kinase [Desulfovibrio mangrovi]|uniref:pyruvate kinase n=1 Tax=Desulfovibrio mangrovi TaxID=2976983 RepID=UPI0022485515|nr:pyruvate kinase [Desulfovibrio mangrovi]UZP67573.1 pyruvate kinase [Desulfovibrio mangrovi]